MWPLYCTLLWIICLHFMVCWIYFLLFNTAKFKIESGFPKYSIYFDVSDVIKSKSVSCEADHGIHWVQNYCQGLFVAVWVWRVLPPVLTNYCLFKGANRNFSWVMLGGRIFCGTWWSHCSDSQKKGRVGSWDDSNILRLAFRAVHYLNRVQIGLRCVGRQVC